MGVRRLSLCPRAYVCHHISRSEFKQSEDAEACITGSHTVHINSLLFYRVAGLKQRNDGKPKATWASCDKLGKTASFSFLFFFFFDKSHVFFFKRTDPVSFLTSLYILKTSHQQSVRGEKSDSWLRKNQSREHKRRKKNYGAFKLIPKAPIGVCIVLFFITFQ